MRTVGELRDVPDPAWPEIQAAIASASHAVVVLDADRSRCETTLVRLQVTARSTLGALALHTGGMLIDHGWLRMLGGGEGLLNLATANGLESSPDGPPDRLLVAFDILGGKYAINGGTLPGSPGEVCYFAPDELDWVPMEMGHGDFVAWSMTDRLATFNEHLRWPGWEDEVTALALDEGISVYPFPFTKEGSDLGHVSRRPVPIVELLSLWEHFAEQLMGIPDGGHFKVVVDDGQ